MGPDRNGTSPRCSSGKASPCSGKIEVADWMAKYANTDTAATESSPRTTSRMAEDCAEVRRVRAVRVRWSSKGRGSKEQEDEES